MLVLLQVMFTDLDFLTALHVELDVLQNFLFEVYCHYNSIPFHNFRHCFCVTQMVETLNNRSLTLKNTAKTRVVVRLEVWMLLQMYGLIWLTDLRSKLSKLDLFTMLASALCHDLDHPGYNNVYQVARPPSQSSRLLLLTLAFPLNFTQINAKTDLALRYNDISPLENHHCAVAFGILSKVKTQTDWS